MSVSVEKAAELLLEQAFTVDVEQVSLEQCPGRVLASDLTAPISQPPFPRSPLDGYAVRAADTAGASKERPAVLKVSAKYYAGMNAEQEIMPGECARIMTGSMLPPGADCVVKQELTDYGEQTVSIYAEHKPMENYVTEGEDYKKGTLLAAKDTFLDAAAAAVAASCGLTSLPVYRRVRVAIISTGDELTQPGKPLLPGKIYNSSISYLQARLNNFGAECSGTEYVGDDAERISAAVAAAVRTSDLVLTTGGVSVGQKDLIPAALESLGAAEIYHGVEMKPGMPTMLSVLEGIPVLSLSGNPFAAAVAFELIAKPFICRLSRSSELETIRLSAELGSSFGKKSKVRRFIRAKYKNGAVTFPEGHSNGQMSSMIGCNCLADIPGGTGTLEPGSRVEVIML